MSGPIERFLEDLTDNALGVDALVLQEALAEIRSHLEESAAGFVEVGVSRDEAERMAVASFGNRGSALRAVPVKEWRLIDWKVFPFGYWWLPVGVVFSSMILSRFWYVPVQGWIVIGLAISIIVRGFLTQRFEISRSVATVFGIAMVGLLISAPMMTIDITGDVMNRRAAEGEAVRIRSDAHRLHGEQIYEISIMEKFQSGAGQAALEEMSWTGNNGFLLPHEEGVWVIGERAYTRDQQIAHRRWADASKGVDLELRKKWADQTLQIGLDLAQQPLAVSYWTVVLTMAKQSANFCIEVIAFVLFLNGSGAMLRVLVDASRKRFSRFARR